MLYILITHCKVGDTLMWERLGRKGRCAKVPTYRMEMWDERNPLEKFFFSVTRDSSRVIFGKKSKRYGRNGECPPHRACTPYRGRLYRARRNGLALMLYEEHCVYQYSLVGQGDTKRTHIMIHAASGSSYGCFGVSGGDSEWQRFIKTVKNLLPKGERALIFVDPRATKDHTKHLSQ